MSNLKRSSNAPQSDTQKHARLNIDPQLELVGGTPAHSVDGVGQGVSVHNTPPQLKTPLPAHRRGARYNIQNSPSVHSPLKIPKKGTAKTLDIDHFFQRYKSQSPEEGRGRAVCKFCKSLYKDSNAKKPDDGRTWVYANSSTSMLRKHIEAHHPNEYHEACKTHGWEIMIESIQKDHEQEKSSQAEKRIIKEAFTREGFIRRLTNWITADDQSLNVIECPEFRALLLYMNETLTDKDIPRRTAVRGAIFTRWLEEFNKLKKEIMGSLGKISFTADIWSDGRLRPYMAITAHWIQRSKDGTLVLRADLIAFHHIPGSHDGNSLCSAAKSMLERMNVLQKTGWWTLDNASNNNTFMVEFERISKAKGIRFSAGDNRIRCFAHVINIAVQHILTLLKKVPEGDVMGRLRNLINTIRASNDRRIGFLEIIKKGNEDGEFVPRVPELELLRDVDTRWDSVHGMLDRVIPARPAITAMFARRKYRDLQNKTLSDDEWKMAEKIRRVLAYPHSVQQLMSGEATPILSGTLPAFQSLQNRWEEHMAKNPDVMPFVLEGMEQLNQYHEKAGKTCAYVIAMALNPAIKLSFIIRNWDPIEAEMAVEWIKDELVQYRAGDSNTTPNGTSATEIHENARIMLGLVDADDDEDGENDETSIDHEYLAYMSAKRTPRSKPILAFWQENEHIYPTWFQMAMDYLPIQASSVPCERVFSSSSETMTKRRNRIKPELMEALQMLKFMLKKKRLDFMDGWKTPITDMQVDQDDDVNTLQDILGAEGTELDKMLEALVED